MLFLPCEKHTDLIMALHPFVSKCVPTLTFCLKAPGYQRNVLAQILLVTLGTITRRDGIPQSKEKLTKKVWKQTSFNKFKEKKEF